MLAAIALSLVLASASSFIRVDQVGYLTSETKRAVLLSAAPVSGTFSVLKYPSRKTVFIGNIGSAGSAWSSGYPYTYVLDFSPLQTNGEYVLTADSVDSTSPPFAVDLARRLYGNLLPYSQFFYLAQRDGALVDRTVMSRHPSHLKDEVAYSYLQPSYDRNDFLLSDLQKLKLPSVIDAEGGWFDAGDFLKFVQTASYVDAVMLVAVRDERNLLGFHKADFTNEAKYGLDWLQKMWDDESKTLYYQVGLGAGNSSYFSDHHYWRLPEFDDNGFGVGRTQTHNPNYYVVYRPVFRANAPGSPISPNLAGRVAADLALCFQVYRNTPGMSAYAARCLKSAQDVYALAATSSPPRTLLTASPHDFYPETEWRDDVELGAAELYFAAAEAHLPPPHDAGYYLSQSAKWAKAYINQQPPPPNRDTLNLYDDSALAHRELIHAIAQAGNPSGLAISIRELVADLHAQVQTGLYFAGLDPFGLGFGYQNGDVVPHILGMAVTAGFYDEVTGTAAFRDLEQSQIDFLFGKNAWGTSFVVGAGSTFPHCMQHVVANLSGSLNGKPPIVYGATVDGPNSTIAFGTLPQMRTCPPGSPPDPFKQFDARGAFYRDRVADWASVEPTDDYGVLNVLEFAREIDGRP
jgi:endoglucanase